MPILIICDKCGLNIRVAMLENLSKPDFMHSVSPLNIPASDRTLCDRCKDIYLQKKEDLERTVFQPLLDWIDRSE